MRILITGGARSGKSAFAERYAGRLGSRGTYVATAQVLDEEMASRLAAHRKSREASAFPWQTVEEPLFVADWLLRHRPAEGEVVLVDCLTLWLSNWVLRHEGEPDAENGLQEQVDRLVEAIGRYPGTILIVTNEVGDGIVPEYPLGRLFRDWAGRLNQRVAERCDELFLVTCGVPVELKRLMFRFE